MAAIKAQASGLWSAPGTWSGGVIPGAGDDVYANNFVVTIATNRSANKVSNAVSGAFAVSGGSFTLNPGVTLTANVEGGGLSNTACVNCAPAVGQSCTIIGNLNPSTSLTNRNAVNLTDAGTLNVVGSVVGAANGSYGINMTAPATVNVTGSVTASPTSSAQAIFFGAGSNNAIINITGNVTSPGTGTAANVMQGLGSAQITVTGIVTAGIGSAVQNNGTNAIVIINGAVYASATKNGVTATATGGEIRATGPCYNSLGSGMKSMMALHAESVVLTPSAGLAWTFYASDHTTPVPLYYAGGTPGNPAAGDVRYGTAYGPGNSMTGTLHMPAPQSVAYGVLVDATTGLAVLTQQKVAKAAGAAVSGFSA